MLKLIMNNVEFVQAFKSADHFSSMCIYVFCVHLAA